MIGVAADDDDDNVPLTLFDVDVDADVVDDVVVVLVVICICCSSSAGHVAVAVVFGRAPRPPSTPSAMLNDGGRPRRSGVGCSGAGGCKIGVLTNWCSALAVSDAVLLVVNSGDVTKSLVEERVD